MLFYSFIIPQYNRPEELDELLASLCLQSFNNFEVVVIDDGSTIKSDGVVKKYAEKLNIQYYHTPNQGQGFARNTGFSKAKGDWFIILDSDVILPSDYLQIVDDYLKNNAIDAFGAPDAAHPSFTNIQKAINYAMTSPLTTGGIRGRKKQLSTYHPRSFNMGISRAVYKKTGGFKITRLGEDILFSIDIIASGFKTGLIEEAKVFHKRRTDFKRFFKQLVFFGRARINIWHYHPSELKWVHFLPALFVLATVFLGVAVLYCSFFCQACLPYLLLSALAIPLVFLIDALFRTKSLIVSLLAVPAGLIQLYGYGLGFMYDWIRRVVFKLPNTINEYPQ